MTEIVAKFFHERLAAASNHRVNHRWDESFAALAELRRHIADLTQADRDIIGPWLEVCWRHVAADRLARRGGGQEEAELRHLTRARLALEHIPLEDLSEGGEPRMVVELIRAELSYRELRLALQVRDFAGRHAELLARSEILWKDGLRLAQQLALRRIAADGQLEGLPAWLRGAVTQSPHLALLFVTLQTDETLLDSPSTLMSRCAMSLSADGDPRTWLIQLLDDAELRGAFEMSIREARAKFFARPAAHEISTWWETRLANDLSQEDSDRIAEEIRDATARGIIECLPYFRALQKATRPELHARACAALIAKISEHAYKPCLQGLFKLTKGYNARIPSSVNKLVCDLEQIWRSSSGPLGVLDRDAAFIRNSESHAQTEYDPRGESLTFRNPGKRETLGPLCCREVEKRLETVLDRVSVVHLSACYLHHAGT
jgi:hypothetical protein